MVNIAPRTTPLETSAGGGRQSCLSSKVLGELTMTAAKAIRSGAARRHHRFATRGGQPEIAGIGVEKRGAEQRPTARTARQKRRRHAHGIGTGRRRERGAGQLHGGSRPGATSSGLRAQPQQHREQDVSVHLPLAFASAATECRVVRKTVDKGFCQRHEVGRVRAVGRCKILRQSSRKSAESAMSLWVEIQLEGVAERARPGGQRRYSRGLTATDRHAAIAYSAINTFLIIRWRRTTMQSRSTPCVPAASSIRSPSICRNRTIGGDKLANSDTRNTRTRTDYGLAIVPR